MNNERQIEYIRTLAYLISDIGECDIICTDIEHNLKDNIAFLKKRYGNYMQLPPEEERVPGHEAEVYWKSVK